MPSDYAQGGWAKLDLTAAYRLAEIAAKFPQTKMEQYMRLLLVLYSSMYSNGIITIGRKALAEKAEVTEDQARNFVEKLEKMGALINLGMGKNSAGKYTRRIFWWLEKRNSSSKWVGEKNPQPGGENPLEKSPTPGENPLEKSPLSEYTEYSDSVGRFPNGTAPTEISEELFTPKKDIECPWER